LGRTTHTDAGDRGDDAAMRGAPQRPRVLVVDDDAPIRQLIRTVLEEQGFVVAAEAANGREAIELAARLDVDAITIDLDMPVLDGVSAVESLCAGGCVPVVIVSGSHSKEEVARAIAAGALAHVAKSDLADHLVPVLRTLLRAPAAASN
jgi:response regulator NasT